MESSRDRPGGLAKTAPSAVDPSQRGAVSLALVHHANQFLVTDGYDNRDGITQILDGYAGVLSLHRRYRVPLSLHLSGTLLETIAWHRHEFFEQLSDLRAAGLLSVIGGTYSENIMTLAPASVNRRQLEELLALYGTFLDLPPASVRGFWVPERVWSTADLAPVITSEELPNGGYRYVLLDNRLLFGFNGSYDGSPRAMIDQAGPFRGPAAPSVNGDGLRVESCRPYRIAGGNGLVVVPMSPHLRYWIPPRSREDLGRLAATVSSRRWPDDSLLVYADDLEKAAGVGPWEDALDSYEAFLSWVTEESLVTPVLLDAWLETHPADEERALEAGTFFELAREWGAGEDYRRWWESPAWSSYRRDIATAEAAVSSAERLGSDRQLLDLAWKHLLASSHETAWHDEDEKQNNGRTPAGWAKAIAAHARACLPISAAAAWFGCGPGTPGVEVTDLDADGEQEALLRTRDLFAVLSPRHGGRLVWLFQRLPGGGALSIGNPTDHWNYQEALNRYMDVPPNHPGGLADSGCEHDRYEVGAQLADARGARVELLNVDSSSPLRGARKIIFASAEDAALTVCYRLPEHIAGVATEVCLSPDYYRLLREGRRELAAIGGTTWRGFRNGAAAVWVGILPEEGTGFEEPHRAEAGHGLNVRVRSAVPHFHLFIGCGLPDPESSEQRLAAGSRLLHEMVAENHPIEPSRPARDGAAVVALADAKAPEVRW